MHSRAFFRAHELATSAREGAFFRAHKLPPSHRAAQRIAWRYRHLGRHGSCLDRLAAPPAHPTTILVEKRELLLELRLIPVRSPATPPLTAVLAAAHAPPQPSAAQLRANDLDWI